MNSNKLKSLLTELKAKVKRVLRKIVEAELIYMINIIARTEMKLRHNRNSCPEEFEKEIRKHL